MASLSYNQRTLSQPVRIQGVGLHSGAPVNLSLLQIHENEVTKRLASYAALIAVPTMIAGIYGMNFEHMPELRSPLGYPIVLGIMGLLDAYLFYRFRKARWL